MMFEVQLPLVISSIMVGINQTTMMALAMVGIASIIGARTLGLEVLLSIMIDRITHALAACLYPCLADMRTDSQVLTGRRGFG